MQHAVVVELVSITDDEVERAATCAQWWCMHWCCSPVRSLVAVAAVAAEPAKPDAASPTVCAPLTRVLRHKVGPHGLNASLGSLFWPVVAVAAA